jgi:hypothetical protein
MDNEERVPGMPTKQELMNVYHNLDDSGTRMKAPRSLSAKAERSRTAARTKAPKKSARRSAIKKILTEGLIPASPTR